MGSLKYVVPKPEIVGSAHLPLKGGSAAFRLGMLFSMATVPVHRVPSLSMLTTLGVRNVPRELGISSAFPCLQ